MGIESREGEERELEGRDEKIFEMQTSTDRLPEYLKYGSAEFTLNGKKLKLNVMKLILLKQKMLKQQLSSMVGLFTILNPGAAIVPTKTFGTNSVAARELLQLLTPMNSL